MLGKPIAVCLCVCHLDLIEKEMTFKKFKLNVQIIHSENNLQDYFKTVGHGQRSKVKVTRPRKVKAS